MPMMTEENITPEARRRYAKVQVIDSSFWCIWSGLLPLPLIDALYVSSIQLKMINELCLVYDVPFSRNAARTALAALSAGAINGITAKLALRFVPGISTLAIVASAAAATYAIGQVFIHHFEQGGDLHTVDAEALRPVYQDNLQHAK